MTTWPYVTFIIVCNGVAIAVAVAREVRLTRERNQRRSQ